MKITVYVAIDPVPPARMFRAVLFVDSKGGGRELGISFDGPSAEHVREKASQFAEAEQQRIARQIGKAKSRRRIAGGAND
ncbi:hypothetical protein [Ancylobacter defluvii]|uniref:Uncharacterized protein n=1 Tax=Ancylobacter defluvii TaxID=1282440 RepID=A0A9W6K269_9HYPH|nr:hypothetical protein [Ancylobacter defluvii]MBS7588243.1 hypothetical protein [Ancylobacter defluvii]GLK86639.1 hypothetical protein GCM10017653_47090 [Ancylobacter defluvii]